MMNDNRLVNRLVDYWKRVKKDDLLPDFKKNNPASIEDIWQQCFVLSIIQPNFTGYKYEYMGDKIIKIYGKDLMGRTMSLSNRQFPDSIISPRLKSINSLSDLKEPQEDMGQMPAPGGKFIKYRTILLPFGNEKAGLTHIVAGVSYREY